MASDHVKVSVVLSILRVVLNELRTISSEFVFVLTNYPCLHVGLQTHMKFAAYFPSTRNLVQHFSCGHISNECSNLHEEEVAHHQIF